jgi:hypothetical protein
MTYVWDHPAQKPFGQEAPKQCEVCLRILSFSKRVADGIGFTYTCTGTTSNGNICPFAIEVRPPPNATLTSGAAISIIDDSSANNLGQWLVIREPL